MEIASEKVMNNRKVRFILPLLLRPFEALSSEEIIRIKNVYLEVGRESFDKMLEKQSRAYASLLFTKIDCDSAYWSSVHNRYCERNKKILDVIEKVCVDFTRCGGLSLRVYENFGAVLSSHISIGCFASGDVDFVVNEKELQLAIDTFEQNGFKQHDREGHAKSKLLLSFFNPDILNGGYWFNIMIKPVARSFMLDQSDYKKRLELVVNTPGERFEEESNIYLLDPTAMVYFNALHFACEHFYSASPGMALCCDIDRISRSRDVDWDKIVKWSEQDNAGLRLQMALDICRYFLKSPIPNNLWMSKTIQYKLLWNKLIDEKRFFLIPQEGKMARLITELLSDNKSLIQTMICRFFGN